MILRDVNALVSPEDLDPVLAFLPQLEALIPKRIWSKELKVSVDGDTVSIERGEYNPTVKQFQRALYDHGCIRDFDWGTWQPKAVRIFENPGLIQKAQMRTCIKLLTLHIRRERFVDGHLAEMLRSGHITAILRRMGELASRRPSALVSNVSSERRTGADWTLRGAVNHKITRG